MYQEDNKKNELVKIALRVILFFLIFILTFKLLSMVFNSRKQYLEKNNMSHNISSLQEVAIRYFKDGNLDIEEGTTKKISLKELIEMNYISELKDEYEYVCSDSDSYVELMKMDNEYRVKTYLVCNNKSDYSFTYIDDKTKEEERNQEPTTTTAIVPETTTTTTVTTTTKTVTKKTEVPTTTTTTTQPTTTAPIVITTKPAVERWSVSYNCNGGTINGAVIYSVKIEKGKEFTLPIPTRDGFNFWHWEDSQGNVYEGSIKPTSDLKLIAKWH